MYFYNEKTGMLHIKGHCIHSNNPPVDAKLYATEKEARDSVGQAVRLCENCRKIRDHKIDKGDCVKAANTTAAQPASSDVSKQSKETPAKKKQNYLIYLIIGTFIISSIISALITGEIFVSLLLGASLALLVFAVRAFIHAEIEKAEMRAVAARKAEEERKAAEKRKANNSTTYNKVSSAPTYKSAEEAYAAFMATTGVPKPKPSADKPASVVGRAVAGAVIAGPAGAVVGALSAVDKNSKSKK